ncbi:MULTISPECIES: DUF222 domain-containing protein [unclassified Gordonia (in: high G+C Gram-positive bacteria)]
MSASSWSVLPTEFLGGVDPAYPDEDEMVSLLGSLDAIRRGESYLAWARYRIVAVLYDRLVAAREIGDGLIVDGFADAAARIAKLYALPRRRAESMLGDAVALRDRLPEVFDCLRDGLVTDEQARLIIARTDLIEERNALMPVVDGAIAATLRGKKGAWTRARLRDMADRIVFRADPHCVRERRREALDKRGMWTENLGDGVGEITGVMTAENIRIAAAGVHALADAACDHDGRTRPQRASDAMFALLSGTRFECQCGQDNCAATIPDPATIPPADPEIVIHVVCSEATLTATPDTHTPDIPSTPGTAPATIDVEALTGFLDGHGIIGDTHVRDLAARPGAIIAPLVPPDAHPGPDGTVVLPAHQPADPYHPSNALDTYVRCRDGYCSEPGCEYSAWRADLDHVEEYNHHDPADGGTTVADNLNAKCRTGHLHKTFGEWTDDQYRDSNGRLVTEFITPEGFVIPADAETLEDLFPGLRGIRFEPPEPPPRRRRRRDRHPDDPAPSNPARRSGTRAANKHARRRAERHRNRKRNNAGGDPPF